MSEKAPHTPVPAPPESVLSPNFSTCVNIEELYEAVDQLEKSGKVIRGSNHDFSANEIRKIIAEVRKARQQGSEPLVDDILSHTTNTGWLRDTINRIVQKDSFVGARERSERSGQPSQTDLDINI